VNDAITTNTTPDTVSTAQTQDNLEFTYPIPMDEDTVNSTEPTIDYQTTATIITNNSDAVSRTQINTELSNVSMTTTKTPHVDTTEVDLSTFHDLASPKDAQNSQNITTLDDKPTNILDARLLNATPSEFLFFESKCFFLLHFYGAAMSHSELPAVPARGFFPQQFLLPLHALVELRLYRALVG
jgi:hypothetical protein